MKFLLASDCLFASDYLFASSYLSASDWNDAGHYFQWCACATDFIMYIYFVELLITF